MLTLNVALFVGAIEGSDLVGEAVRDDITEADVEKPALGDSVALGHSVAL
jgi:hypothetical protein